MMRKSFWLLTLILIPTPVNAAPPPDRPTMDEAEVRALIPLVRENVVEGGIRLARLLDDALGGDKA